MKTALVSSLALVAMLGAGVAPALAEQSRASEIIFGKAYDDDVIAIQSGSLLDHDAGYSEWQGSSNPLKVRRAQAEVGASPHLLHAIAIRGILLQNVLWIDHAANGGAVIYYQ